MVARQTQHTVDKTRMKHDRQTDTLSTRPARSMVARQTQLYTTHVDKTRTKHGHQTDTTLHNTLSTRPARSMVARQTQHYMTHCKQDRHKAWTLSLHYTHCQQTTQTFLVNIFILISTLDTILHDILSTKPYKPF